MYHDKGARPGRDSVSVGRLLPRSGPTFEAQHLGGDGPRLDVAIELASHGELVISAAGQGGDRLLASRLTDQTSHCGDRSVAKLLETYTSWDVERRDRTTSCG